MTGRRRFRPRGAAAPDLCDGDRPPRAGWCSNATRGHPSVGSTAETGDGGDAAAFVVDGQIDAARRRGDAGSRGAVGAGRAGSRSPSGRAPPIPGAASRSGTCWRCGTGSTSTRSTRSPTMPRIRRAPDAVRPGQVRHGRLRGRPAAGGAARVPFNYSSGTSNVISGIVAREVGPGAPYRRFLAERLFGPLGMTSASATLDEAGTWVAASYVYATARDFAQFGLLYLRDGVWDSRPLLPEGWVDHGRRPRSTDPDGGDLYGSHWWTQVGLPAGVLGLGPRWTVHRRVPFPRPGACALGPDRQRSCRGCQALAGRVIDRLSATAERHRSSHRPGWAPPPTSPTSPASRLHPLNGPTRSEVIHPP